MEKLTPPSGRGARVARFLSTVASFERNEIEAAVDGLIALLDARDGDADMEDDDRAAILMFDDGADPIFDELGALRVDWFAEDDDPAGGDIVDEPHDEEEDVSADDHGECGSWAEGDEHHTGGGHTWCDGEGEDDAPELRLVHRDRVRATRCTPFGHGEWINGYTLRRMTPPPFGRPA